VLLAAVVVAAGGCGGDDEEPAGTTAAATTSAPTTTTEKTTSTEAETTERAETREDTTSPEEQEGGAGDEEPIRSPADFAGKGGTITPRRVQVPPFIAIRVVLRSADGGHYELDFGHGRRVSVSGARRRDSVDLPGLSAGENYSDKGVRIEATAEPGP
jgi:hypothetical protein